MTFKKITYKSDLASFCLLFLIKTQIIPIVNAFNWSCLHSIHKYPCADDGYFYASITFDPESQSVLLVLKYNQLILEDQLQ